MRRIAWGRCILQATVFRKMQQVRSNGSAEPPPCDYAPAYSSLGYVYAAGVGVTQDYRQAAIWLSKAMAQYEADSVEYDREVPRTATLHLQDPAWQAAQFDMALL